MSETLHAGCVVLGGRGVLIVGGSGSGKSDLALRLIDRGAGLVSDDYTVLRAEAGRLFASAPAAIAGRIEVRGIGLVEMAAVAEAPLCLLADLGAPPDRLPEPRSASFLGLDLPAVALAALETSAAIKLELALDRYGLPAP